jgi:hypothetical protein
VTKKIHLPSPYVLNTGSLEHFLHLTARPSPFSWLFVIIPLCSSNHSFFTPDIVSNAKDNQPLPKPLTLKVPTTRFAEMENPPTQPEKAKATYYIL